MPRKCPSHHYITTSSLNCQYKACSFELQQIILPMSTCLKALSCCHVIGGLDIICTVPNKVSGEETYCMTSETIRKSVHTVPGHVMWQEGVGITFRSKRIWGSKVPRTSRSSSVARLLPFLLSRHALQQADLLFFLLSVPQLPLVRIERVAVAWERGGFLRHLRERVTRHIAVLEPGHLALRAAVRRHFT